MAGVLLEVMHVTNQIEESMYAYMDEEQRRYYISGCRVNLLAMIEAKHPGSMVVFLEPRTKDVGLQPDQEGKLAKMLHVTNYTFVYQPMSTDQPGEKEPKVAFLQWAWKVFNAFQREDPLEALADAWAMGFRPDEPPQN